MAKVTFTSENAAGECPGVLVGDPGKSTKGLIVLQEWWGMDQPIQDKAADIAMRSKGQLVTLVPDLYRGKVTIDREEAGHLMSNLDWRGAVKDIQGAARFLLRSGCTKVGVTGFCMGGALSLAAAVLVPEISASVPFYGIPSPELADLSKINIPLQCHFANQDNCKGFSSPTEQKLLVNNLLDGWVQFEFHSYKAEHAFTNPTRPSYNKECSEQALTKMIAFMNEHL